jgi:hypothetical protein
LGERRCGDQGNLGYFAAPLGGWWVFVLVLFGMERRRPRREIRIRFSLLYPSFYSVLRVGRELVELCVI